MVVRGVMVPLRGAMVVVRNAWPASADAAHALPELKPNQPNHSMAVPSSTCGTLALLPDPPAVRGPRYQAATRAA